MKRIGIIGVGGVANGAHISQLLKVKECKITAICDIDPGALQKTASRPGLEQVLLFEDYKELIDSGEVDAVEICTPNHMHVEIATYAAKKGIPFESEKPLGMSVEECVSLEQLVKESGLVNMMCFSYRFIPAVRYAKWMIDRGLLGDIISVSVEYLKSSAYMEGRRLDWRFVKQYAGTGVLGDLGVHLIDMATLLIGDVTSVSGAMMETVVKKRMRLDRDEWADVETDDLCNFTARLQNRNSHVQAVASFFITRCAMGHRNTIRFDLHGTEGAISFDLNDPNNLKVCVGTVDKKSDTLHTVPVPGEFFLTQEQAFVNALHGNYCDFFPTVFDGVKCQKIIEAILTSANNDAAGVVL